MQKNIIISLIFAILIAVFAILNAAAIEVNFIFATMNISAALVILISACLGAIIVYSIDTIANMKEKKKYKDFDKRLENLLVENDQLKTEQEKQKNENEQLKQKIKQMKAKEVPTDE